MNLKLVRVEIEGELYWFLFDTGAPTLIVPELAEKLKVKKRMSINMRDSNNQRQKTYVGVLKEMKISEVKFENFAVVVAPMEDRLFTCYAIKGIIGANLMSKATWRVTKDEIYIANAVVDFDVSQAVPVKIKPNGQKSPYVQASLDSVQIDRVLLDYGSNGGFDLTESVFHQNKNHFDSNWVETYGYINTGLYGSTYDTAIYQLNTLHLGELTFENIEIERSNHNKQKLGCDLFNQYDVVLSWDSNTFYFTPDSLFTPKYEDFGISFGYVEDGFVVTHLSQYSDAHKHDIHIGDKVLKINHFEYDTENDNFCDLLKNRTKYLKGEELELVLITHEGEKHKATLRKLDKFSKPE